MTTTPAEHVYRDVTITRITRYRLGMVAEHLIQERDNTPSHTRTGRKQRDFLADLANAASEVCNRWDANEATEIVEVPA